MRASECSRCSRRIGARSETAKKLRCKSRESNFTRADKRAHHVCHLLIAPLAAELWDGPASATIAAFEFAKARLTGEEPKLGENRKVTVEM